MEITSLQLIVLTITSFFGRGLTGDVAIELDREVLRDGFHRDLRTTLNIQQKDLKILSGSQCSVLLIETLPSGLYVDTFQLGNLASLGGPQVLTDRCADIEAPEYLSSQHELYVYTQLPADRVSDNGVVTVSVSLPVHVRYHKPSAHPDIVHVSVTIFHPRVLLNCSTQESRAIKAPCDADNTSTCAWNEVSYKSNSHYMEVKVPVGREQDAWTVVFLTLVVTVMGCTVLLYVITFYDKWRVKVKDS